MLMRLFQIVCVLLRMALIYGKMRTNGYIQYEVLSGGGINEFGEAITPISEWSEPIPCSIKTNSDNRKGKYEDGEFRRASFTILVELMSFPHNRIKLERYGEQLGEYRVMSAEPLTSVGRTQILV